MSAARLPVPGHDDGAWGNVLNDFLSIEHNADGTHNIANVERTTNKGIANGYAPLNGSTQIASSFIPTLPQSHITNLTTDLSGKVAKGTLAYNVRDYGALGDAKRIRNVTAAAGSASVTVPSGTFGAGDVGKLAVIYTETTVGALRTIASVQSATQITLNGTANITVSGATGYILYGTDDSAAITSNVYLRSRSGNP